DHVDHVETGAAVLLGNDETGPAQLRHLLPLIVRIAALVLHHLAHERHRALGIEELTHALAQHFLFFAESEIHRSSWRTDRSLTARGLWVMAYWRKLAAWRTISNTP